MDLGQVFTRFPVARYMASLFSINKESKILDPCFGEGAFLSALANDGWNHIDGYEIDSALYEKCKNKYHKYKLKNEDFLSSKQDHQYDGVIMNPTYVRQEKINELSQLGVSKGILSSNSIFSCLPTTANLYMYFIIKAISVLKKNGELIVIFPGSWLFAKNGDRFREILHKSCVIDRQINISGDVFEKATLVDVIILKLRKTQEKQKLIISEYVKLINNTFVPIVRETKNLHIGFTKKFKDIGNIRRGLTTGCNSMFINPTIDCNKEYTKEIISSPKQVNGYTTDNAVYDKLLIVSHNDLQDASIDDYFRFWRDKILKENKPKTLVAKINKGYEWYRLNLFECNGIIFSYFVRNDMKFIINKSGKIIRDNFYIVYPAIDEFVCFALLNNYYTFYQLECSGKKYGAGLLKLQRYDLENLSFPDFFAFSKEDVAILKTLTKELIDTGSRKIISEITKVLSSYSDISFEEISTEYEKIVASRLENV